MAVKIGELLDQGTELVWVVRLVGPRRVEVHAPSQPMRVLGPGEVLTAPGILRNPVPVEALYDREAGHRAVLRNLLQRQGYESIEAIRSEGLNQGIEQGIEQGIDQGIDRGLAESVLALLEDRGLTVAPEIREHILACHDRVRLRRWLSLAIRVEDPARLLDAQDRA
jgi:hypothetical protein